MMNQNEWCYVEDRYPPNYKRVIITVLNDEEYFYGIIFDWNEKKQSYSDGGTGYLSKNEFYEKVKSFREVF